MGYSRSEFNTHVFKFAPSTHVLDGCFQGGWFYPRLCQPGGCLVKAGGHNGWRSQEVSVVIVPKIEEKERERPLRKLGVVGN